MAFEQNLIEVSVPAAVSFAAGQYRAGVLNSSGALALAAAGGRVEGVVQNKPAIADTVTLAVGGVTKMEAGAAVAAGARVAVDAAGRGVTATTGNYVLGVAMEAAGASGVYFPLLITHAGLI